MVTRSQSVQNFNDKMSDLVNSKFIVAEKKISEVLISISDSVLLFELFKHVSESFDYDMVKSVCFGHDSQGAGYFKLPKSDGDVLAFGFALLSEIDGGEIDLIDLCAEFFPSVEGKQRSYSLFATQFLIPFQQTALKLSQIIIDSEDAGFVGLSEVENQVVEEKTEEKIQEEKEEVKKADKRRIDLRYVEELKKQVLELADSLKKGRESYDELFFVLEEFGTYLREENLRGITLAFTAIKHIKQSAKKVEIDMDKLAKLVSEAVV